MKILLVMVAGAGLLLGLALWLLAQKSQTGRPGLELENGQLRPCPASPNCVSSQADPSDSVHYLPPIGFEGDPDIAWQRLIGIVARRPDARVIGQKDNYLRAEFRSRIFGFVDDVEFVLDPQAGKIHFRSASRVGYGDFGANRRRIEAIRAEMKGL